MRISGIQSASFAAIKTVRIYENCLNKISDSIILSCLRFRSDSFRDSLKIFSLAQELRFPLIKLNCQAIVEKPRIKNLFSGAGVKVSADKTQLPSNC